MSYSAFFTAGLTLASQPREYELTFTKPSPLPLHINVHPSTPRRTRKRRSSLTIATSPINTIKVSSGKTATDIVRSALRSPSPRDATFLEAFQNASRPKTARRVTVSHVKELPSRPAPTSPLPTLPNLLRDMTTHSSSVPKTPTEETYPSSPIAAESPRPAYHTGALRANPSRKSSFLLPLGRGALLPNAYGGNIFADDSKQDLLVEMRSVPAAVWFDDDEEDMKENGTDI